MFDAAHVVCQEYAATEAEFCIDSPDRSIYKPLMKETTKRSINRWIHIVFGIPIAGYVYSPFKELPNYAPVVRYVALPVIVLSGLWMWKGAAVRRLVSKAGKK